jgi:hypothetical protein
MLNLNKEEKKGGKVDLKVVSINEDYSMGIPMNMSKTTSLNDDASLQFQNIFKETYVIVIDENKKEFINAYMELSVYDTSRSALSNYSDTQVQSTTANMDSSGQKGYSQGCI